MKYTKERPTAPGYYWYKTDSYENICMVFREHPFKDLRVTRIGHMNHFSIAVFGGEWAGPVEIKKPE